MSEYFNLLWVPPVWIFQPRWNRPHKPNPLPPLDEKANLNPPPSHSACFFFVTGWPHRWGRSGRTRRWRMLHSLLNLLNHKKPRKGQKARVFRACPALVVGRYGIQGWIGHTRQLVDPSLLLISFFLLRCVLLSGEGRVTVGVRYGVWWCGAVRCGGCLVFVQWHGHTCCSLLRACADCVSRVYARKDCTSK